jgi:hypothetical protein
MRDIFRDGAAEDVIPSNNDFWSSPKAINVVLSLPMPKYTRKVILLGQG